MSLSALLLVAATLVFLGAVVYVTARNALRMLRHDGRLRLHEAVQGQGLALPDSARAHELRGLAIATRRCLICAEHARCDRAIEACDWSALRELCPNHAYIDGLRAR